MKFPPPNPNARAVADLARQRFLAGTPAPESATSYVAHREAADDIWVDAYERELTARGLRAAPIPLPPAREVPCPSS